MDLSQPFCIMQEIKGTAWKISPVLSLPENNFSNWVENAQLFILVSSTAKAVYMNTLIPFYESLVKDCQPWSRERGEI